MKPDNICDDYSKKGVKLDIQVREDTVFIEGDKKSLEFLGNLILAQAEFKSDTSFHIGPTGPGSIFFNKTASFGIYINRK